MVEAAGGMKMVTKLLAVAHLPRNAAKSIGKLGDLKAGQTMMLEICPKEAALFERIYDSKDSKTNRVFEFAKKQIDSASTVLQKKTGKKISDQRKNTFTKSYSTNLYFFYRIFEHAKKKNVKCLSLDSDITRKKVTQFALERRVREEEKLTLLVRERAWTRRIKKTEPDYAVIGLIHLNELQSLLGKKDYPTKIAFKQKPLWSEKIDFAQLALISAFSRAYYRMDKAKKIRARQRKTARRK